MRACGDSSKARSSNSPSRPEAESGEYSLSMQNSARCVSPVTSTSTWRSARSTSQGGAALPSSRLCRSSSASAISSSRTWSLRASSTRGAWLVGPMNRPENRYERDGWLFQ
jgi:hypothetical protein